MPGHAVGRGAVTFEPGLSELSHALAAVSTCQAPVLRAGQGAGAEPAVMPSFIFAGLTSLCDHMNCFLFC